ncbi:MAG: sugar transferase [Acidimicrobiales bacterium]
MRYKRLFDVVVASLALVALLPLMTLVAFLVLTTSRGPVLYRSERWGHRGSTFGAIKFRSMCADADAALAAAMASDPETAAEYQESFKLQRDPASRGSAGCFAGTASTRCRSW